MVKLRMTVRGGLLLALWASIGIFLLATLLFILFSAGWWVWAAASIASAGFFAGFPWSYRFRDITVGDTEIRVRGGRSFRHVRRLPRRFVSGCLYFATPVQRLLGICTIVVYTPGSFAILIGLRKQDGQFLLDLLSGEVHRR